MEVAYFVQLVIAGISILVVLHLFGLRLDSRAKNTVSGTASSLPVKLAKVDPLACAKWNANQEANGQLGGESLAVAFSKAFSAGEMLAHLSTGKGVENPTPDHELRATMVAFCKMLIKKQCNRMICQDARQTKAIVLDVISPARTAPPGISYSEDPLQGSLPFIPVRWHMGSASRGIASARIVASSFHDTCPVGGTYELVSEVACTVPELNLLQAVLEEASARVDAAVQGRFASSPLGHDGAFQLSYLPVLPPSDAGVEEDTLGLPDPEGLTPHGPTMPCHRQGCGAQGTSRCSQCKGAYYCSNACQKADWKARHRVECSGARAEGVRERKGITQESARASVLMDLGNKHSEVPSHMMTWSNKLGATQIAKAGVIPASYHPGEFVIKVQVPLMGAGPLMVYDQARTFMELLPDSTDAARTLAPMIRRAGVKGIKGYFDARREGDKLRVFTDRMAAPQAW